MRTQIHKNKAFTLIEVLVVIIIITILITVLLPSLSSARDEARFVTCRSKLSQIGLAHAYYRNDFKQALMTAQPWPWNLSNYTAEQAPSYFDQYWPAMLYFKNYITDPKGFRCPADPVINQPRPICWILPNSNGNLSASYGMNYFGQLNSYLSTPVRVDRIVHPDETYYVTDNSDNPNDSGNLFLPDFSNDGIDFTTRHKGPVNGYLNMSWIDLHISPLHYNDAQTHYYYGYIFNPPVTVADRWYDIDTF